MRLYGVEPKDMDFNFILIIVVIIIIPKTWTHSSEVCRPLFQLFLSPSVTQLRLGFRAVQLRTLRKRRYRLDALTLLIFILTLNSTPFFWKLLVSDVLVGIIESCAFLIMSVLPVKNAC
jgi:hypothetical protein